jgi:hypothetical protein
MKLFHTLHDALEAHLPAVADEADRMEALTYLRGLKTALATVVAPKEQINVQFEDRLLQRRIETSIAEKRLAQLADARRCGELMNDYGWPGHGNID